MLSRRCPRYTRREPAPPAAAEPLPEDQWVRTVPERLLKADGRYLAALAEHQPEWPAEVVLRAPDDTRLAA